MQEKSYAPDRLFGKKSDGGFTVLIFAIVIITVCISVYSYFFAVIRVSGPSMLPTLNDKQFVLFRTHSVKINRNDIVTINIAEENKVIIKRVVAIAGDKVLFMYDSDGNHVSLYLCKKDENTFSKCEEDPSIVKMTENANYKHVTLCPYDDKASEKDSSAFADYYIEIPEKSFYYLGDNRNISQDAREYGIKSESDIVGKAILFIKPDGFVDRLLASYYSLFTKD